MPGYTDEYPGSGVIIADIGPHGTFTVNAEELAHIMERYLPASVERLASIYEGMTGYAFGPKDWPTAVEWLIMITAHIYKTD